MKALDVLYKFIIHFYFIKLYLQHHIPWQFTGVRNAASFFLCFVGVRFSCGGVDASKFLIVPVEAEGGTSVAAPAGWLFWNLMAHPLLGEGGSTLPPRCF